MERRGFLGSLLAFYALHDAAAGETVAVRLLPSMAIPCSRELADQIEKLTPDRRVMVRFSNGLEGCEAPASATSLPKPAASREPVF